jgi:serine/threonine protein kinase
MHNKWQLVRDLFERALEEQPADLDAWLADATDDPEVRDEVRSLLKEQTEVGLFLSEPVQDRVASLVHEGEDEPFPEGHEILHYKIVRQLPPGGMGRVYLATDTRLRRDVVLKAVAARFAGNSVHEKQLRREAIALAELDHEGICKVYAFEEYKGEAFIVTEFVKGRTLREEISAGTRPLPGEVLRTAQDIAAALACAHASRIAHRDLKPENVMRMPNGRIKIIDFGIARIDRPNGETQSSGLTQQGFVAGTPIYMAPEQLAGETGSVRTDVFAFGVLIYELACGLHPFGASPQRILESNAPPIESLCPSISAAVGSVIHRCLMKAPDERFASAVEIAAALPKDSLTVGGPAVRWWRAHQAILIGLYFVASAVAWFIKQELGSLAPPVIGTAALTVFGVVSAAATVGGFLRGHLLFVERVDRPRIVAELQRAGPFTLAVDAIIGLSLVVDTPLLFASARDLPAALIAALGIGIVIARLLSEPSTTDGAFGRNSGRVSLLPGLFRIAR